MVAEVFISYAGRDRIRVLNLVKRLREAGVSVWIDQSGIDVSSMWSQEIVSAIKGCKVMLLSISPNSTESENVVKELALASERKKPIIPVFLEAAQIPETMEYQLAGIQRVGYFGEKEDLAFKAMLRSLIKRGIHVDPKFAEFEQDEGISSSPLPQDSKANHIPGKQKRSFPILIPALVLIIISLFITLLFDPFGGNKKAAEENLTLQYKNGSSKENNQTSITVLPFKNIGPTGGETFLADGMHEEIDAMLSMTPSLRVKNVSRLKDSALDPKSVGEALNVDSVLAGTVRQAGGKLRVTVKLIDTKTEENIWASTFDKDETDIFLVQREIAQKVVEGLELELGQGQVDQLINRQTDNLEAYNLYIEGRKLWNLRTREGMRDSIEKFELALNKDQNFALAHVGIADAYNQLANYGFSPSKIAYPKAREELAKAFLLNENLSEAFASQGWIIFNFDWDWIGAEEAFRKALSINPNNAEARRWLSHLLWILGRYEEAFRELDMGIEIMPRSENMLAGKAFICTHRERYEEAISLLKTAEEFGSEFVGTYRARILAESLNGNFDEAQNAFLRGDRLYEGSFEIEKSIMLALKGDRLESEKILISEIDARGSKIVFASSIAGAYYYMGKNAEAFKYLNEAIEEKDPWLTLNFTRFNYENVANDARFKEIRRKMQLPNS